HWLTQLVKEHRIQSAAMLDALDRLATQVAQQGEGRPATAGSSSNEEPGVGTEQLVATERGTMAHRSDCVVVAGKTGLRSVSADDGFGACKLCDPY
ncbi:MAG: hypothetical protein ABIY48_04695, partial [Acidimicrobiales bacterium]